MWFPWKAVHLPLFLYLSHEDFSSPVSVTAISIAESFNGAFTQTAATVTVASAECSLTPQTAAD